MNAINNEPSTAAKLEAAFDQICDAQRIALIEYGDARSSGDPHKIAAAFVNALHTHAAPQEPAAQFKGPTKWSDGKATAEEIRSLK